MRKEIIGDATLYMGDCLEVMQDIEAGSVNAVVTDPPYGDGFSYGRMAKTISGNKNPLLNCLALSYLPHLLKDAIVFNFTSWRHYPFLRMFLDTYSPFQFRHVGVWVKNNFGLGSCFRPCYEMFMVFELGDPVYQRKDFSDVQKAFTINHSDDSHPHEKPVDLIGSMVSHATLKGQLVLDPFMGSGTAGVACVNHGRRFIGIELSEKYFDMACKRIDTADRQGKLFEAI